MFAGEEIGGKDIKTARNGRGTQTFEVFVIKVFCVIAHGDLNQIPFGLKGKRALDHGGFKVEILKIVRGHIKSPDHVLILLKGGGAILSLNQTQFGSVTSKFADV